jgi:hypothetical protein
VILGIKEAVEPYRAHLHDLRKQRAVGSPVQGTHAAARQVAVHGVFRIDDEERRFRVLIACRKWQNPNVLPSKPLVRLHEREISGVGLECDDVGCRERTPKQQGVVAIHRANIANGRYFERAQ